jgi:23S rRNA pseudouridine2605 synthase
MLTNPAADPAALQTTGITMTKRPAKPRRRPVIGKRRPSRSASPDHDFADASRGIRLQKVLADAGVASRRDCEAIIEAGRVRVNGRIVASLPAWVDAAEDHIEVDGEAVHQPKRHTGKGGMVYVMLNKPRNVISTTDDERGRVTVNDLIDLPPSVVKRLYPVGRLDADSTGLILLTNDGDLAHRLTHPSYEVAKVYRVAIRGVLSEAEVEKLQQGILLAHRGTTGRQPQTRRATIAKLRRLGVQRDRTRGDRTLVELTLHEGQNREIRRVLAKLGHKVRRLDRVSIGPLSMKGLARGQWRLLDGQEVAKLKKAVKAG